MAKGAEQFRRAITEDLRNTYLVVGMHPLIVMHQEMVGDDEFNARDGIDDSARDHFLNLLLHADRARRRVTYNPEDIELGDAIEKAIAKDGALDKEALKNPFGGDEIQNQSGGLYDLPWALDGTDVDIKLNSQVVFKNGVGLILFNAVNRAIVNWTRLNSRDRTKFITPTDSLRIYGDYQAMYGLLTELLGDANRIDVAQVLPSDEPLGPTDSPNVRGETANPT